MFRKSILSLAMGTAFLWLATPAFSQLVILPAPRLLTLMPMGAQAGTEVEVTYTGENLEDVSKMLFSTPKITAKPVVGADGEPVANKFLLTVAADAPIGVHDVRVMSRLGISSPRAFTVGKLPEVTRTEANTSIATAMPIQANSICNAVMTARSIDYYSFEGKKDQRVVVECAASGIDSRLTPVVIIADEIGRDLVVNRTGGVVDFTPEADGKLLIKVNDLTFQGTNRHFYRLALQEVVPNEPAPRQPSTSTVSSMSWPPEGIPPYAPADETEPNDESEEAHKLKLPCDISGSFFPAADVDTFEFAAKKGEEWWVEVASERVGLPTDPFVLVQKITIADGKETATDVAELYDIKSPVKLTSNGYSYDGPPYDTGSPDVLGKLEIKEDGTYRLQVRDLFGGTRNEPTNTYRLIVRKPEPDFSLAAWAVHMTLRNGDRAAFSKPIALRAGASKVFEVVAIRRDGFDGKIELGMENLPAGVSASGLMIPSGKSVGHVVITADENVKTGLSMATFVGKATIGDKEIIRPCQLATMEWPVRDAKQEIPSPRLVSSVAVSVTDAEKASLSIATAEDKVFVAQEGEKLTIPLKATWREEFSGSSLKLKAYGHGFEKVAEIEIPIKAESKDAVLDLAALKLAPGEYTTAFYGGAVTKYRYHPEAVEEAQEVWNKADKKTAALAVEVKKLTAAVAAAPAEKKLDAQKAADAAVARQKVAIAAKAAAAKALTGATKAAVPKDIVDIVVSEPIKILVKAAPVKTAAAATPPAKK